MRAADGRILNVSADYPRLEDAIAASTPGDVILFAAGTHPGDVEVPEGGRHHAIYAIESRDGVMEHGYASGAADAAFCIGECNPCDTVVGSVTAVLSAVGYSGTNAGGNLILA